MLREAVEPGVTTADLDDLATAKITARGAQPSFLGYHGYPATLSTSVNEQIVHALPPARVRPQAGDVVSLDCGGWPRDATATGPSSPPRTLAT